MDWESIYKKETEDLISACKNHNVEIAGKKASNNTVRYYMQCLCCGYSDKIQMKKPLIQSDKFNQDLYENFIKTVSKNVSQNRREWENQQTEIKNKEWLDEYSKYLNSQKWATKRIAVLKRDNFLCQACLKNKATQVHHLTYRHVMDEPLFDLVSVCTPCHENITEQDRK